MLALLGLTMLTALFAVVFNWQSVLSAIQRAIRVGLFAHSAARPRLVGQRKLRRERSSAN